MVARGIIDSPLLAFDTKSKPTERARDLRDMNLFPKGLKGSTEQVTLKSAYLLLYVLAVDPKKHEVKFAVDHYAAMKNEKTGVSFFDDFPRIFEDLRSVESVEISKSFPYVIVSYLNGTQQIYSLTGDTSDTIDNLTTITRKFPKRYLLQYYQYCIQTTNRGYQVSPLAKMDDEIEKMIARDQELTADLRKDWPTKEDIIKGIAPTIKRSKY